MRWRPLVLALFLGSALGAQTLVLGAEDAAGPWGGPDGAGCGNDLVRAAYQAVGVPVTLKILPYARAKEATLAGTLAGCFSMSPAPELQGKVVLSREPLYAATSTLFRRQGEAEQITSLDNIPGTATVGVVNEYEYPEGIQQLERRGVRLVANRSEVANLEMLARGRLTLVVVQLDELKSLDGLLAEARAQGHVALAFRLASQGSFLGFSLAHPQGRWAKETFDQGFAVIKTDGTLQKILKTWKAKGH